jgi:hypothetical protein
METYTQPEPSYRPDIAAELDSPAEILADEFKIPLVTALAIYNRFQQTELSRWEIAAPILHDVLGALIQPSRNLKAKIWGLVFSSELADVANGNKINGIGSMSDEAKRQDVSRALLSKYKRDWDKLFGRYGRTFGKSPEACEANRRARLRVLDREREAA